MSLNPDRYAAECAAASEYVIINEFPPLYGTAKQILSADRQRMNAHKKFPDHYVLGKALQVIKSAAWWREHANHTYSVHFWNKLDAESLPDQEILSEASTKHKKTMLEQEMEEWTKDLQKHFDQIKRNM